MVFRLFDKDKDGALDADELAAALRFVHLSRTYPLLLYPYSSSFPLVYLPFLQFNQQELWKEASEGQDKSYPRVCVKGQEE